MHLSPDYMLVMCLFAAETNGNPGSGLKPHTCAMSGGEHQKGPRGNLAPLPAPEADVGLGPCSVFMASTIGICPNHLGIGTSSSLIMARRGLSLERPTWVIQANHPISGSVSFSLLAVQDNTSTGDGASMPTHAHSSLILALPVFVCLPG